MIKRVLAALAVVTLAVVAGVASKQLISIKTKLFVLEPTVLDAGTLSPVQIAIDDGFNSVECFVPGTTPVYFGGSTVTVDGGYPICNGTSCAGRTISASTYGTELYSNLAARVDGGVAVICISGK